MQVWSLKKQKFLNFNRALFAVIRAYMHEDFGKLEDDFGSHQLAGKSLTFSSHRSTMQITKVQEQICVLVGFMD